MRIHTQLTEIDLMAAANAARVMIERLDVKGSRSHHHAFDVILSGSSTRRAQSGDHPAATWDEWGIFLGKIFELDPEAKTGMYRDAAQFHRVTGERFLVLTHNQQHRNHHWQWSNGTGTCACGATVRHAH